MLSEKNMAVVTNIIGGVETGGQVFGQRRYEDYTPPYKNSPIEHTITLGWAAFYGAEARRLIQKIYDADTAKFKQIDASGSIQAMLSKDWVAIRWNPTASQKAVLVKLITSDAGKKCQDAMFAELMKTYVADCEKKYTKDVKAIMMYCEIRHLGGSAVNRIFDRLGGDYSLDAIMASLVRDQKDTSSNNQVGDRKYWTRHLKCRQWADQYADVGNKTETKEEETKMSVDFSKYYNKISNSGGDEYGGIAGGTAGDQTGGEWNIRSWYNRPWSCVLRHPDAKVRELLAELAIEAANNNKIGYDQYQRDTYWAQLQKVGYRPSKITVACEADCSAGVIANTKAVGYLLGISALKNIGASYTGNMRSAYRNAGFQVLTDSKYLNSADYLLPGDILLNDNHHTATNLGVGSKSGGSVNPSPTPSTGGKLNTTQKWQGVVTADELSVRTWAGTENKECSFSPLKKGAYVSVCDTIQDSNGADWYYIKYFEKYGFVHSAYVDKYTAPSSQPAQTAKPKTVSTDHYASYFDESLAGTYKTTSDLYCRKDAGVKHAALCVIPEGHEVKCFGYYNIDKDTDRKWFLVQFELDGTLYIGFASSYYMKKE